MKEKLLITRRSTNIPNSLLAKILKTHYKIDNIVINKKNVVKNVFHIIKNRKKYDKVIVISGPVFYAWFVSKFIPKKTELIAFIYDFNLFRSNPKKIKQKIGMKIRKFCEKRLFLRADKIIHKGLENELEFLPFYDKIKNKPHYLFRDFLDYDLIEKYKSNIKLSKKDGRKHLVYVGGLYIHDTPRTESFWKLYKRITSQKIHFHIYSKQTLKTIERLKKIEKKNYYFHYEGFLNHKKLIKKLTKYDYGFNCFGNGYRKGNLLFNKFDFSNKIFDYMAAPIPIITNKELKALSNFVNKNKIGISIKYNKIDDLKFILSNIKDKEYETYIENIENMRKNMRKNKKFLNFLK